MCKASAVTHVARPEKRAIIPIGIILRRENKTRVYLQPTARHQFSAYARTNNGRLYSQPSGRPLLDMACTPSRPGVTYLANGIYVLQIFSQPKQWHNSCISDKHEKLFY